MHLENEPSHGGEIIQFYEMLKHIGTREESVFWHLWKWSGWC